MVQPEILTVLLPKANSQRAPKGNAYRVTHLHALCWHKKLGCGAFLKAKLYPP